MRISARPIEAKPEFADVIPTEVKIWLSKGWKIIPTEREGYVLAGQKTMRGRGKAGFAVGAILLLGLFAGIALLGLLGVVLLAAAWVDFRYNTKAPTMFFPAEGEKSRFMKRD